MLLDEDSKKICAWLLDCIAEICDLRHNTVQVAAAKLGVPTEQINLLLKGDLGKVRINTILSIAHQAGKQVMVEHGPKEGASS